MLYIKKSENDFINLTEYESVEELVKGLTNDYVLYLTVNWYLDRMKLDKNIGVDTSFPALTPFKLLFYPFHFSTANGHANNLYDIMQPFTMVEFGAYSQTLLKHNFKSRDGESIFFTIEDDSLKLLKPFDEIEQQIANTQITSNYQFKDLYVKKDDLSDYSTLMNALKSSRKALEIGTNNEFLDFDVTEFQKHSKSYREYIGKDVPKQVIKKRPFAPSYS